MDVRRSSSLLPTASPGTQVLHSVASDSDRRPPAVSFSIDEKEMDSSSAFLVPGQEFACMDAPINGEGGQAGSPSIGGSPAWVRASAGAAFLDSRPGLQQASMDRPCFSPPRSSRQMQTRTSPEMLEAFGRSPSQSEGSDPRSLENSFEQVAKAPLRPGGSPLGPNHPSRSVQRSQDTLIDPPGATRRAPTPRIPFKTDVAPDNSKPRDQGNPSVDELTLRPEWSPGGGAAALQHQGPGKDVQSPGPAEEAGPAVAPPSPLDGTGSLQVRLAELALERDAATREARELREALASRAEAMARLKGTLDATEEALASAEERLGRAQECASSDLGAGRAREQQLRLQLTDAEERAEARARSLAEASRKIAAMESAEEKLLELIEAQQSDIRVLNSRLTDREGSSAALKEALFEADSEKQGLSRAVQRARDDTDDMRRANRVLQRSIEGQEKEIEELKASLAHAREELRELQRRNHWLECQQQAAPAGGLRGSFQLEPRPGTTSASLHSSMDGERLLRGTPQRAPPPLPMPPARDEGLAARPGTAQSHLRRPLIEAPSPRPAASLSQDDLGVLKHLMDKVKAAKGPGAIDPSNPPGLGPDERQVFKYLWDKMKESGPGVGADSSGPYSAEPAENRAFGRDAIPEAASSLPQRRFANRPAPWATGDFVSSAAPVGAAGAAAHALAQEQMRQPEASPFGTDETLRSTEATTKDLEERLLKLNQEKDSLDAEYARMPLNALRTQAQRERKAEVEDRLDKLSSDISKCKRQIKRAGGM